MEGTWISLSPTPDCIMEVSPLTLVGDSFAHKSSKTIHNGGCGSMVWCLPVIARPWVSSLALHA
jgi:hypothetical protein